MNSDTKEQYFYMQNKRCKVVANDQCITIQNELQPNLQTVIKLTDLISIRLCTCRKTSTKLVCKCIQEKNDLEQKKFINPTLTKNIVNGNFEREISFVHADSAFDSNEQFQLPRVDSTLSTESANINDDEEEFNEEDEIEENECIDENENCIERKKIITKKCIEDMNEEDEGVLQDDQQIELDLIRNKNLIEIKNNNNFKNEQFEKQDINEKHITKVLIDGSNSRFLNNNFEQKDLIIENNELIKNLDNKENLSLESDDLNCSIEDDDELNQDNLINNQIDNKRRVSILKDLKDYHAQSTLMTSTSSGISTSSCNSTLNNKLKESSPNKILIRCIRLFYCVPYGSFNFKIKFINLIPEYLQDNLVITPEQIYNHNNEQFNRFTSINSPIKNDYQFEFNNDQINSSLNTLNNFNSLEQTDQRINMINLLNATSQNRILEQKRIKQFVNFIKDYLEEFERPKSLLLFVNPIGGKKRAPAIYKKICQPLLSISSISYHTIFTQKANHAYELLRNEDVDLSYYQAIGCVGGDGMYSEILNGMLKRNKVNSNSSSPIPANENIKPGSRRNSSATQKSKNKKSKQQAEYSDSSNDDENKNERTSSGQSNRTTQSYQNKKAEILNQKRRQKLGVRYSLPNDKSNFADTEELNLLRNGKRYSLPISPFKSKSIDLGSSHNLPLLIVPGGSTDAVSFATNGINDPQTVMCNFVLGKKINIDVAAIHTADEENRLIKFCSSFLGYGYFGDILKDSEENLRWMGPKRYDWAGLKKFFLHKVYKGELLLKVSLLDGDPKDNTLCLSNCQLCARSYIRNLFNITELNNCRKNSLEDKKDDEMNDENNEEDDNQNDNLIIKNINKNKINLDRNKLTDDENTSIVCIKGRFLAINAATLSCRCGHSKYGISPSQHIGNGCCDLIVVAQCNRKDYLKYLFRTGFSEKSAFDLDFVNVYRVKEFTFTPILDSNQSNVSVWNCDGEILNQAAINVKIHCQLVSVFGSGLIVRPKNKQFVKREKLHNAIKLKLKNKDLKEEQETNAKRHKTSSFKKSTNCEERRPSKVEFQLPQSNMIYEQKTIGT